jgi:hypothetical protein
MNMNVGAMILWGHAAACPYDHCYGFCISVALYMFLGKEKT